MENAARGAQRWLRCSILSLMMGMTASGTAHADAVTISPRWMVSFPSGESEKIATASPVGQGNVLVTVLPVGASQEGFSLKHGSLDVPVGWCVGDPISRLFFLTPGNQQEVRNCEWQTVTRNSIGEAYTCTGPDGLLRGTSQGWVKQVGGKVLPFALLRIDFENQVPPCGSPVLDASGKVGALVFQKGDEPRTCYAIPAEAVLRVQRDMEANGKLMRGWLGLTLLPENETATVVKVFADSPADKVGLKPNDILQEVGGRLVMNYADAANAFFYLMPGEPVLLKFRRGANRWEITAIPSVVGKD